MTSRLVVRVVAVLSAVSLEARAQQVGIQHDAIGCVPGNQYPMFEACFADVSAVARARVNFKSESVHLPGSARWSLRNWFTPPMVSCCKGAIEPLSSNTIVTSQ